MENPTILDIEIPSHMNMRIDPKVRYLTELAARARGVTITEYIESALLDSFRGVFLDSADDPDEGLSLEDRRKRLTPPVGTIAHYADALWSENPGKRLALRSALTHLMTSEENVIWDYIMTQDDLAPKFDQGRKPNYKAIADRWPQIKQAALRPSARTKRSK